MKKILTLILLSILSVSLIACGKDSNDESEITNDFVIELEQGTIQTENEVENNKTDKEDKNEVVEDVTEEKRYIEIMENNISDDIVLNTVCINDKQYTLPFLINDIEEITECSYATSHSDIEEYYFSGPGWGIKYDPDNVLSFEGGFIFFMYDENEENVIAATTGEFWTEDDLKISFAGISVGDSEEYVESLLGKPERYDGKYFYKNNDCTLVIEYDFDDLVDEIHIFKNR